MRFPAHTAAARTESVHIPCRPDNFRLPEMSAAVCFLLSADTGGQVGFLALRAKCPISETGCTEPAQGISGGQVGGAVFMQRLPEMPATGHDIRGIPERQAFSGWSYPDNHSYFILLQKQLYFILCRKYINAIAAEKQSDHYVLFLQR